MLHGDDTEVKLRVPGARKTRKAHLWVGIGDADYPYVVFDFTADYTAAGPERFLRGYRGYLQADALAQYEGLYGEDKIRHVCCWAHARRKFVAALEGGRCILRRRWHGSVACTPSSGNCHRCFLLVTTRRLSSNVGSVKSNASSGGNSKPVPC